MTSKMKLESNNFLLELSVFRLRHTPFMEGREDIIKVWKVYKYRYYIQRNVYYPYLTVKKFQKFDCLLWWAVSTQLEIRLLDDSGRL